MRVEFFAAMNPPTTTQQMHKITTGGGQVRMYEPPEVKAVRVKLTGHLAPHRPDFPLVGAVRLMVKWCFPQGRHGNGEYKTTRPDTDNLQKMLKDVMTDLGYWRDDAQVASEIVEKFWARIPGIYVCAEEIGGGDRDP